MSSIKEKMIEVIKNLPEDSSYEEILQELSFINMINQGLKDSKNNKITKHSDLKKELKNW